MFVYCSSDTTHDCESINLFPQRWPFIYHKKKIANAFAAYSFFLRPILLLHELKHSETNRFCAIFFSYDKRMEYTFRVHPRTQDIAFLTMEYTQIIFLEIEVNPNLSINVCKCQVHSGNASHNDFECETKPTSTMTKWSTQVHTDEK